MSFLYPTFLWALSALSIPIIIHLFNFRKTTRIYFSNTRFLKQVKEATTAKRRIKHYLTLLARLLALTFLILAFAQPVIPAREQLTGNRNLVLYVDNSLSASAQLQDKTKGLDAALQFCRDIVDLFPTDTRYKLITNDFAPFSNSYKTKTEILDLLTEVRLSPISRTMGEIKQRIQLTSQGLQEVFWISDFQKSTIGSDLHRPADSLSRWHLVPLAYGELSNVFIDSVFLENPFATGGEKNALHVNVRNDGKKDIDQLSLKLTINGIQSGTASLSIPAKGVSDTQLDLTTSLQGFNKGQISFNDFPMSFDNEFYFALNAVHKVNIIEVKGSNATTPVEQVFGNKDVFDFHSYTVNNFNYSLLSKADLVVVNGLNSIDASFGQALRSYGDAHGTMFIIPGAKADATTYQSFTSLSITSVSEAKGLELDRPDFNIPFFENVFEEKSRSLAMPKASQTLSWGNDRSAILRFKNDQPFLSLINQTGKIYIMSCPLENDFTDFSNHALFVPVMYRMAASGRKNNSPLYYSLNQTFLELQLDSLSGEEPVRLVGDQEIVPSQRRVGGNLFIDLPRFSINKGFYKEVAHHDTVGLLAFNIGKKESMMDQFTGEEVKKLMGGTENITLFDASSANAFSNEIKARYLGKPLWKYAIMLALFFLLAEILLIRFLK